MSRDLYKDYNRFVTSLTPTDFVIGEPWKLKSEDDGVDAPKCRLVLFYADWCPHCIEMVDDYVKIGRMNPYIEVSAFNCNSYSTHCEEINSSSPGLINGYPTIVMYKDGNPVSGYGGSVKKEDVVEEVKRFIQASGHCPI